MAVYISVITDSFGELDRRRQPMDNIRRPLRGITIKEDTYAIIRVLTAAGREISLFDSSSPDVEGEIGKSTRYANFIVQSVQEQRVEKQQIVETFGEDYIFFFGERPRFLNVAGMLLNTKDFNWKSEFWENYEKHLRGTRLVEQNARLYFYFDDVVVEGYIVSASTSQDATNPYHLPFQFQLFITNYAILSTVGSVFFQQEAAAESTGLAPEKTASQRSSFESFSTTVQQYLQEDPTDPNKFRGPRNNSYKASTNRPIHEIADEYVERAVDPALLKGISTGPRTPQEFADRARRAMQQYGVDTNRWAPTALLLGQRAFASQPTMGAFGIRQAAGVITGV